MSARSSAERHHCGGAMAWSWSGANVCLWRAAAALLAAARAVAIAPASMDRAEGLGRLI